MADDRSLHLLLAAILLDRFHPMAPHHVSALRERLGEPSDDELQEWIFTGTVKLNLFTADNIPTSNYPTP